MKRTSYHYSIVTLAAYTKEDVDLLMVMSQRHYDSKCRQASQVGGIIYGMKNRLDFMLDEEKELGQVEASFTTQDLDLLCKITEIYYVEGLPKGAMELSGALFGLLREAYAESGRVNVPDPRQAQARIR